MCFSGFQCFSLWVLEVSSFCFFFFDLRLCVFSGLVFVCFCVLHFDVELFFLVSGLGSWV